MFLRWRGCCMSAYFLSNGRGTCRPEHILASFAGTTNEAINFFYSTANYGYCAKPHYVLLVNIKSNIVSFHLLLYQAAITVPHGAPWSRSAATAILAIEERHARCRSAPPAQILWTGGLKFRIFFFNEFCISMTLTSRVLNYKYFYASAMATKPGESALAVGFATIRAEPAKGSSEPDASTRPRCSN